MELVYTDYTTNTKSDDYTFLTKDLNVGDWIITPFTDDIFYVYRKSKDGVYISTTTLPNFTEGIFIESDYRVKFLGTSKPNFWYKLFWWTNWVHPVKLKK
jgi:hypothetical protein